MTFPTNKNSKNDLHYLALSITTCNLTDSKKSWSLLQYILHVECKSRNSRKFNLHLTSHFSKSYFINGPGTIKDSTCKRLAKSHFFVIFCLSGIWFPTFSDLDSGPFNMSFHPLSSFSGGLGCQVIIFYDLIVFHSLTVYRHLEFLTDFW